MDVKMLNVGRQQDTCKKKTCGPFPKHLILVHTLCVNYLVRQVPIIVFFYVRW